MELRLTVTPDQDFPEGGHAAIQLNRSPETFDPGQVRYALRRPARDGLDAMHAGFNGWQASEVWGVPKRVSGQPGAAIKLTLGPRAAQAPAPGEMIDVLVRGGGLKLKVETISWPEIPKVTTSERSIAAASIPAPSGADAAMAESKAAGTGPAGAATLARLRQSNGPTVPGEGVKQHYLPQSDRMIVKKAPVRKKGKYEDLFNGIFVALKILLAVGILGGSGYAFILYGKPELAEKLGLIKKIEPPRRPYVTERGVPYELPQIFYARVPAPDAPEILQRAERLARDGQWARAKVYLDEAARRDFPWATLEVARWSDPFERVPERAVVVGVNPLNATEAYLRAAKAGLLEAEPPLKRLETWARQERGKNSDKMLEAQAVLTRIEER